MIRVEEIKAATNRTDKHTHTKTQTHRHTHAQFYPNILL